MRICHDLQAIKTMLKDSNGKEIDDIHQTQNPELKRKKGIDLDIIQLTSMPRRRVGSPMDKRRLQLDS